MVIHVGRASVISITRLYPVDQNKMMIHSIVSEYCTVFGGFNQTTKIYSVTAQVVQFDFLKFSNRSF